MTRPVFRSTAALVVIVGLVVLMVGYAGWQDGRSAREEVPATPFRAPRVTTSRADLRATIERIETRLRRVPTDSQAAVELADALMRQARVARDGSLTIRAEEALKAVLNAEPLDYEARRMLGVVYLSQHRFRDAIREATRARDMDPIDASNYGVIGDGCLEIGDYDRAFDAFQQMMDRRPNAAAYARAAYAAELQGHLDRALHLMQMAAEATTAHDPESQAWHYAQLGNLLFQMGRLTEARRQFERANQAFPGHPYATDGSAKVKAAEGDLEGALAIYRTALDRSPTPELAAHVGDLWGRLGNGAEAERHYVLAERLEREGWKVEEPQPAALSLFLAERDRKLDEALALAEKAAADRHDIHTLNALAWAQYKTGRIDSASATIRQAMRTGTRDRRILYHAAAIARAAGDPVATRALVSRALEGNPHFDLIAGPAASRLLASLEALRPAGK